MAPALFQTGQGLDPLVVTLGGFIGTALLGAVTAMWRQAVAESKRKDALIDRLLNTSERSVTLEERRQERHDR